MLLLKKEVRKVFQDCKMIAVVQNNASNSEDMLTLKHRLHKHSLTVKFFPNQVGFPLTARFTSVDGYLERSTHTKVLDSQPIPGAYNKAFF